MNHNELDELLLEGLPPREVRARWLSHACGRFDASSALIHGVRWDPEHAVLRCSQLQMYGDPAAQAMFAPVEGVSIVDLGGTISAAAPMNQASVYQAEDIPKPLLDIAWKPAGIHSALVVNGMVDGRFVGMQALYRTHEQPPFRPSEVPPRAWVSETVRMLSVTDVMLGGVGVVREVLVCSTDGTVRMRGPSDTTTYLSEDLDLAAMVRAFAQGSDETPSHFEGIVRLEFSRLRSPDDDAVMVVATPTQEWKVSQLLTLPSHQRSVADYAAHGATVPEIAKAMDRSQDTVRSHLKHVYRALGLSNRAELATACAAVYRQG